MNVLLVDDSSTMRRIQKTQLENFGVDKIIEAGDGEEAMEKLETSMPIDIILLDWNMPVMDGLTFLKEVRKKSEYSKVKIFMCTSESEKPKVFEALQAGANNYIVKPFSPEALKKKLEL